MTKPISFIDDLLLDDQAHERYVTELAAYSETLDQQERLQATTARLVARLQTIAQELLSAGPRETATLLAEQATINSSLLVMPLHISQIEFQRVIAYLTLLHAQWHDSERTALECQAQLMPIQARSQKTPPVEPVNRELERRYKRACKLAAAAKARARIDYGCEVEAYSEWWQAAGDAAQRAEYCASLSLASMEPAWQLGNPLSDG